MSIHPELHPYLAGSLHSQRQAELEKEASNFRMAASHSRANKVERFFLKRREGKVTWIETVWVQRSA